MSFTLRIPGSTSNLGPGFDTLGLALGIYNRVTVIPRDDPGVELRVSGEGEGELPEDESNLFYRAALATADHIGTRLPGLEIEMHNEVPLTRGLGSSAIAVVGGITAANRLAGEPLQSSDVLNLAAEMEGHPDNVSPCLLGGFTVSSLVNGRVKCINTKPPARLKVVLAVPEFEIETKAARALLPDAVPHADAVFNVSHAALVTAALFSGDLQALRGAVEDRLHEPYRLPLVPGFEQVRDAALDAGALGAFLSGAGPTILAFGEGDLSGISDAMSRAWQDNGVVARVNVIGIDLNGVVTE